jgi:hypothetical protein
MSKHSTCPCRDGLRMVRNYGTRSPMRDHTRMIGFTLKVPDGALSCMLDIGGCTGTVPRQEFVHVSNREVRGKNHTFATKRATFPGICAVRTRIRKASNLLSLQSTTIEAVTTRLGSHQAPGDEQGHFGCAHKHTTCSWRMNVSTDTTHFRLTSRRHGWNKSQNASDRKGLLSFGCILEQLELLEMLYRRERAYFRTVANRQRRWVKWIVPRLTCKN